MGGKWKRNHGNISDLGASVLITLSSKESPAPSRPCCCQCSIHCQQYDIVGIRSSEHLAFELFQMAEGENMTLQTSHILDIIWEHAHIQMGMLLFSPEQGHFFSKICASDYIGWYLGGTKLNENSIGYFFHMSSINRWLSLDFTTNAVSEFISGNSKSAFSLLQ